MKELARLLIPLLLVANPGQEPPKPPPLPKEAVK